MTQAIPLFLFRVCEGCDQPLPLDAHASRKRHPECAYAKALENSRAQTARLTMERQATGRAPVKCEDCPAMFMPQPQGAIPKRCPECRAVAVRRWKAEGYRRSAAAVPADNTRPCRRPECKEVVRRNWNVYPDYCSDGCKPRCSVDPCDEPARKMGWCAAHYSQWRQKGEVKPFIYKWAAAGECVVCGEETGVESGFKKYCSAPCKAFAHYHCGTLPEKPKCVHCWKDILATMPSGRRRRFDARICRRCRQDLRKYGVSAEQLAERDGPDCRLCGEAVDMTKRAPDPGCPSVDHRIPRARGGTNDPANLQLTHLICNILKHDKLIEEYVLAS